MRTRVTELAPAVLLVASFAAFAPAAIAQPTTRTAGEIALLANALDDAAVQTVAAAIASDDAMVRAAAARLAAVSVQAPLAATIERAFAKERNPAAAAEQARALLLIGGAQAAASIDVRLADLPAPAVDVYGAWLAANQPERLADLVKTLGPRADAVDFDLTFHVGSALKALEGKSEQSERLLRTASEISSPARWRMLLDRLSADAGSASRDAVLIAALKASNAGIREATVWHLVSRVAGGRPVTSAVLTAAVSGTSEEPPSWESFGRELLARRHAPGKTIDRSALLTSQSPAHMNDARTIALMPQLTDSERQALKSVLGSSFPQRDAESPPPFAADASGTMRTIPPLWPGFLEGLLAAAKCNVEPNPKFGYASAVYRADGRVAKLQLDSTPLPAGCSQALQALARLTVIDPKHRPADGAAELLVLPIGTDFVECSNRMPPEPAGLATIGGAIKPPSKTKDVRPDYPPQLRQRGITGTVVLEAIISPAGCVNSATVVRSVVPAMDFAAVKAVTGWQFTPTLVDGKPVPVIMTVTLNFSLR